MAVTVAVAGRFLIERILKPILIFQNTIEEGLKTNNFLSFPLKLSLKCGG